MSMGSDLRDAILEDKIEEIIQKKLHNRGLYTSEQITNEVARQMAEQREQVIDGFVTTIRNIMKKGISFEDSLKCIPESYQDWVKKKYIASEQKRKEQIDNDAEIVKKLIAIGYPLEEILKAIPSDIMEDVKKRIVYLNSNPST